MQAKISRQPLFKSKFLILLIGESGSGKTTLANQLNKQYGLKILNSYTTRPKRYEDESGHVFITEEEAEQITTHDRVVADTIFDGHLYFATWEQIDDADVYIVDPDGFRKLLKNYYGNKKLVAFFINTDEKTRRQRMRDRGDTDDQIEKRIKHDLVVFPRIPNHSIDMILNGKKSPEKLARIVMRHVKILDWWWSLNE